MLTKSNHTRNGHILVEVLLAMSLFVVIATAVLGGFISVRDGKVAQKRALVAKGYLDQATEALRSVRERDWALVATNGTYYPKLDGSMWALDIPGDPQGELVDGFRRKIVISDVNRDAETGEVVASGDVLDTATKKAELTISWGLLDRQKVTATQLLTRYYRNDTRFHTLESDFNDGVAVGTVVTTDYGNGEVVLGAGGKGNWCKPGQSVMAEQNLIRQGIAGTISAVEGIVYAGTGGNASGEPVSKILVSQDDPPQTSVEGQADFGTYKTNTVFADGDYVYLATDTNSEEILIINTVGGVFTKTGWVNAPGVSDAGGVYVVGDVGYMVNGTNFSTFDLTDKNGSRSIKKTITLPGTGNSLVVTGSYAYVATSSSSKELQIIDISDPNNPSLEGYANISGGIARDVFVNLSGTRAYIATSENSGDELFVINTETKSGTLSVKDSIGTGDMNPKALTVVPGNKAIVVGSGGEEYQAFNIVEDADGNVTLSKCGFLDFTFDINDISSVLEEDGDAFSYIATSDADNEIKVIEGGPGGNYATEGTFESEILDDFTSNVQFNRFDVDFDEPENATVKLQTAVFQPEGGSCANVISPPYVGPGGTSSNYFEGSGIIPFYSDITGYTNPGKCFRYKLFFTTTDSDMSPIFKSLRVNISL